MGQPLLLDVYRRVVVVEMAVSVINCRPAILLYGVVEFVVVVKFNAVAKFMHDDRIDLDRGAFHQVKRKVDVLVLIVETAEGFVPV